MMFYKNAVIKIQEGVETTNLTSEQPTTLSKYEGLRAAMAAELMISF